MASTQSPTRSASERPKCAACSGFVGLHPEEREVCLVVDADDLGLQFAAVGEVGDDLVGILDDVIVRHDQPGGIDHEARAERLDGLRLLRVVAVRIVVEEILEQLVVRRLRRIRHRRRPGDGHLLRRRDVDDRIEQPGSEIGEGELRQAGDRRLAPGRALGCPLGGSCTTGLSFGRVGAGTIGGGTVSLARVASVRALAGPDPCGADCCAAADTGTAAARDQRQRADRPCPECHSELHCNSPPSTLTGVLRAKPGESTAHQVHFCVHPRTSHTSATPRAADITPAIRSVSPGVCTTCVRNSLHQIGKERMQRSFQREDQSDRRATSFIAPGGSDIRLARRSGRRGGSSVPAAGATSAPALASL